MNTFKDAFLLDPNIVFLNHGSFGATPRVVFEAYQRWQRELERQPVEFLGRRFADLMRAARTALAEYVHVDANDVVYVPNATTALNIVARSLPLQPGDEILTTDHEYGAMDRMWQFIARKTGAVYRAQLIPVPVTTPEDFIEQLWAGVTPRTRVVFLSHITSPTALIFPVREICRRARAAGITSIVDGAHAIGQVSLDLEDIGADFYTSNLHKWLCCPKGSAFLYARREMQHWVEPLIVSWGYEAEKPSAARFIDEQEWTGTRDIAAYLVTPTALEFFRVHQWDEVRAVSRARAVCTRTHQRADRLAAALTRFADVVRANGHTAIAHLRHHASQSAFVRRIPHRSTDGDVAPSSAHSRFDSSIQHARRRGAIGRGVGENLRRITEDG